MLYASVPDVDLIITAACITGGVAAVGIAGTVMMDDDNRLALESGRRDGAPFDGRELVAARRDIEAAIADADAMDNLLVTLIREEQRSNGRAVLTGQ